MKYKITIETLIDQIENKYPLKEIIYEQIVDIIDMKSIVSVVNEINNTKE